MNKLMLSYLNLNEKIDTTLLDDYECYLSDDCKKKLNKIKSSQHQRDSRYGKLLLLFHLEKYHKIPPTRAHITLTHLNRPFLTSKHVDFNISHAGGHIIVGTVNQGKIGVDIEQHRQLDINLYTAFLNEDRMRVAKRDNAAFFEYWTQIEAVGKAHGDGIHERLKNITINKEAIAYDNQQFILHKLPKLHPTTYCNAVTTVKVYSIMLNRVQSNSFLIEKNTK